MDRVMTPFLRLGTAWYPEHWEQADLKRDIALMVDLGINTVRVGEFAWAKFEKTQGHFDTQWLADAMDMAHEAGIGVVLCTPTAAAPAWLFASYPDLGFVRPDGYRYGHGGRQAADYTHPAFRQRSCQITQVIAQALGKHPAVIAWQTDNELCGHQKLNVSAHAITGWHQWLKEQYQHIDQLNEAWGTQVWSQAFNSFEQVPPPYPLANWAHNHALHTAYRRYMLDNVLRFQREQIDIIRQYSDAPITHNSEDSVDEWDLFRDLDSASQDLYTRERTESNIIYRHDCFRSLKPGKRFWVMETESESCFEDDLYPIDKVSNFAMTTYCSGAQALSYWPWRQNLAGSEIIGHSFLVYANGNTATAWEPVKKVAELRGKLNEICQQYQPAPASVAFIRSERHGNSYYMDRIAGLEPNFDFRKRLEAHHTTLQHLGVWRDVQFDQADLAHYRVVVSPYLPYTTPAFLKQMHQHLVKGGIWIAGPYTGYLTAHHTNPKNALLGEFEKEFGFTTRHWAKIEKLPVTLNDGKQATAIMHAHSFEPAGDDQVLGTYGGTRLAGCAWGIRRHVGQGVLYILGSEVDDAARSYVYQQIVKRENIPCFPVPNGVHRLPQVDAHGHHAWALINTTANTQTVSLPSPGMDLLTGKRASEVLEMAPYANAFIVLDQAVVES